MAVTRLTPKPATCPPNALEIPDAPEAPTIDRDRSGG
jgi:hypothetical protein